MIELVHQTVVELGISIINTFWITIWRVTYSTAFLKARLSIFQAYSLAFDRLVLSCTHGK